MLGALLAAAGPSLSLTFNEPQEPAGALLIHAERLIVSPGVELARQDVLVQDGVIVAVGVGLAAPEGAREISGAVVCASFLDPWSSLGIDEGSARDQGTSPATRTADAIDPYTEPHHLRDALRAGVTSVRAQAGMSALAGGFGSVVRLDPELATPIVLEDSNMGATVGTPRGGRDRDVFERIAEVDRVVSLIESGRKYDEDWTEYRYEREEWEKTIAEKEKELDKDFKKKKKDREKAVKEAEEKGEEHEDDKYKEDKPPRMPRRDADAAAMARVAEGEVPLVVEAHRFEEIKGLLEKTATFARVRIVLAGGTESEALAPELARRHVPVIVWPKPTAPSGDEWDGHDLKLAGELHAKDVEVLIGSGGSAASRELRLVAALAVSQGLDREAALHAITLGPARAFDVADRLGSVERGKDADLIVLEGDPLDTTARIQYVVSRGRVVVEPQ